MKVKFRYECKCGEEPTRGSVSGSAEKCEIAIGIVERVHSEAHRGPRCIPLEQARKNKVTP